MEINGIIWNWWDLWTSSQCHCNAVEAHFGSSWPIVVYVCVREGERDSDSKQGVLERKYCTLYYLYQYIELTRTPILTHLLSRLFSRALWCHQGSVSLPCPPLTLCSQLAFHTVTSFLGNDNKEMVWIQNMGTKGQCSFKSTQSFNSQSSAKL